MESDLQSQKSTVKHSENIQEGWAQKLKIGKEEVAKEWERVD
jgi:hypothetical protein